MHAHSGTLSARRVPARSRRVRNAVTVILSTLDISADDFARETGWEIKPEGACRGDICVPLGGTDKPFDVSSTAERLGMALVRDDGDSVWAIGPESLSGRSLMSARAPELVLPDLDGNEFHLSSLAGHKVVLVSWAPY